MPAPKPHAISPSWRPAWRSAVLHRVSAPNRLPLLLQIAAGAALGALASLAFPPVHVWPLVGLSMVALFTIQLTQAPGRAAATSAAFFATWTLTAASWLRLVSPTSWLLLAALQGLLGSLDGYLAARLARAAPRFRTVAPPVAWLLIEKLRAGFPFGGFAWGLAAPALVDSPLRWLAPWGGPMLMEAALVTAAATASAALHASGRGRWPRLGLAASGSLVVALSVALSSLSAASARPNPASTRQVAVVQGVVPVQLTASLPSALSLVVWGEGSVNPDPRTDAALRSSLSDAVRQTGAPLVANGNATRDHGRSGRFNTTYVFETWGIEDTYAKRRLVPFGEYVPLRRYFGGMSELASRVSVDLDPGNRVGLMRARDMLLGTLICYESVDPDLAREEIAGGAQLLVVTTSNRRFGHSANAAQHIEIDRMLALSTGRTVIHAAVSGASALIHPDGKVVARLPLGGDGAVTAWVPLDDRRTPFDTIGDWPSLIAVAIALVLGGSGLLSARRRANRAAAN